MPERRPGESRDDFFARCMADPEAVADFPDPKIRGGFCGSKADEKKENVCDKCKTTNAAEIAEEVDGEPKKEQAYKRKRKKKKKEVIPKKFRKRGGIFTKEALTERYARQLIREAFELPDELREGGVHWHLLDRANGTTFLDGEHQHMWELPDGTFLLNEPDGAHQHPGGIEHVHAILLEDGTVLETAVELRGEGGELHAHDWLVRNTGIDGIHDHELQVNGQTLVSISPEKFYEQNKEQIDQEVAELAAMMQAQPAEEQENLGDGTFVDIDDRGSTALAEVPLWLQ